MLVIIARPRGKDNLDSKPKGEVVTDISAAIKVRRA